MKIAILGAPGAGKSKFAAELALELDKLGHEPHLIIDNYVRDLQADTGLAYGEFGNVLDDLQVVFKRRECELLYGRDNQGTITVGTVLDSTVHNFVRSEEAARTRQDVKLTTELLRAVAATFGLVYSESWDYDYAFILRTDSVIDRALVSLLQAYRAPVLSFNSEVSDDKKASTAAAAIQTLEGSDDTEPTPPDERGVRRGGEDGEADGNPAESVPDVPEQRGAADDS